MNSSTIRTQVPSATRAQISDDTLSVDLSDGRTISAPLAWYPRLSHGTSDERNHWQLIGNGRGVRWPDLDEDISVGNLLDGQPSGESQTSFKRWLDQRMKRRQPATVRIKQRGRASSDQRRGGRAWVETPSAGSRAAASDTRLCSPRSCSRRHNKTCGRDLSRNAAGG